MYIMGWKLCMQFCMAMKYANSVWSIATAGCQIKKLLLLSRLFDKDNKGIVKKLKNNITLI